MPRLNPYQFNEDNAAEDSGGKLTQSSREIYKAQETRNLSKRLTNFLEVSEERGVLIVPFRDGPIATLLTIDELIDNEKNFDYITPAYVKNFGNYSQYSPLFDEKMKNSGKVKRARPFSLTYEGGSGQFLLNSIRTLTDISERTGQIAGNVRFQASRIPGIQTDISDFQGDFEVDFGYKEDSSQMVSDTDPFPKGWDSSETNEEKQEAKALIRKLLHRSEYFDESPFRSVEQIRSLLIARFDDNDEKHQLRRLYKRLDSVYPKLGGFSTWEKKDRNIVTKSLLNAMAESNILNREYERGRESTRVFYSKGFEWKDYEDLFESYLTYYNNESWSW